MNKAERIKVIKAMELLARQINDEEVFERWLTYGVADGDISKNTTNKDLEWYLNDYTFEELMTTFLQCMSNAKKSGGLYCDGVLSN